MFRSSAAWVLTTQMALGAVAIIIILAAALGTAITEAARHANADVHVDGNATALSALRRVFARLLLWRTLACTVSASQQFLVPLRVTASVTPAFFTACHKAP